MENVNLLINAFRKAELPIVFVNVIPNNEAFFRSRKDHKTLTNASSAFHSPDFANFVDEIQTKSTDIYITKNTWNAFYKTSLHDELQKHNITGIILSGVSTSIGVEGTARAASELGYNISFAIDAMTDRKMESHQHSICNIFPRLGEVGTSNDIILKLIS